MKTGLIGEKLGHSFSKIIHEAITSEPYDLIPLSQDEFHHFMKQKDFDAINVTIPYKEAVIPYCDEIDEKARAIHAVNAIKNVNGKLMATNTDFDGLLRMIENHHFDLNNKVVAICGTGGTSKTAVAVVEYLQAKKIYVIGRHKPAPILSYQELLEHADEIDFLINTTSVGMFPNCDEQIVDLKMFPHLQGVIDVVYNPLRTSLCVQAKCLNIPYLSGLEMLVGQAVEAIEFFRDIQVDKSLVLDLTQQIRNEKMNLVLIGMPTCGKTTIGRQLAHDLNFNFIDIDEKIVDREKCSIAEIFVKFGEDYFRHRETQICQELSLYSHHVISCGGGIIKNEENIKYLAKNGWIIFLHRDLDLLSSDDSRPLSSTYQQLQLLYEERLPLYKKYCDSCIDNNSSIDEAIQKIIQVIQ